jgi:hypothetical protein
MLDNNQRFIITDYGRKPAFASFLPGIGGKCGIPIWCFYVNRGQCITSFGVENKDHAIMEFSPAHQAYQNTKRAGFRTFIKKNGNYIEPFHDETLPKTMSIGMNELEIRETDHGNGIETIVQYFTLPNERVGALIRKVTIRNIQKEDFSLELLDGMPAVIPYGVNHNSIKNMAQTSKAWMKTEDVEKKCPYFHVSVSMEDTAAITEVIDGNFSFSFLENGEMLPAIVDAELIFEYDTSLERAVGFAERGLEELLLMKQNTQNNIPCCFYGKKINIKAGAAVTLYEVYGKVENKEILAEFTAKCKNLAYFENKAKEANQLIQEIAASIHTETSSEIFDSYCKQTYLDNVLRGGYPVKLGNNKVFYLYSRKHGDIERDYNYFTMLPEYYSQGNANYRDVNQNRRSDVRFTPYVGDKNIKTFFNLIQIDGYNPLVVDRVTYQVKKEDGIELSLYLREEDREELISFLSQEFTPGGLMMRLQNYRCLHGMSSEQLFELIMERSEEILNAVFSEGYWTDHWTYNLDLIESYLSVYPDKEEELLFDDESYTYYEARVKIYPREHRYVKTKHGIRQYQFLDTEIKKKVTHRTLRSQYGQGEEVSSNLFEKLLLIIALKYATLDPYGMGVEMEGGKPGWYDALNGLPGIFGSSMAESYELSRLLSFSIHMLKVHKRDLAVFIELAKLISELDRITESQKRYLSKQQEVLEFWNAINEEKESYRDRTLFGVNGEKVLLENAYLIRVLEQWAEVVGLGIEKAMVYSSTGICPTYFAYELIDYEEEGSKIYPKKFQVNPMPEFLEGPVRYMKLLQAADSKKKLYRLIKSSDLYDKKLYMYKVNASLEKASFEIGRAKAFTPGWLENESIWLHMEYKYLLELLKAELYMEFFEDFERAGIPFLNAEDYGRSTLENVSFIASSANPNEKIHGMGFVARLSGSTAEFLNIWQIMMFGKRPFRWEDGKLRLIFEPALPQYLIGKKQIITARFLGSITVTYHIKEKRALVPGNYTITSLILQYSDHRSITVSGNVIGDSLARDIREGRVASVTVYVDNTTS